MKSNSNSSIGIWFTCRSYLDRIFILFPAHAIGLSQCRARDGGIVLQTEFLISGWWAGIINDPLSYRRNASF